MLAVITVRMLYWRLALIFLQNVETRGRTQSTCRVLTNRHWIKSVSVLRTLSSKILDAIHSRLWYQDYCTSKKEGHRVKVNFYGGARNVCISHSIYSICCNLDKLMSQVLGYRLDNLLAAHFLVAHLVGWGIKLTHMNDFRWSAGNSIIIILNN
jgi:hypothetical protein